MEKIYVLHYINGFNIFDCHITYDLENAKYFRDIFLNGPLGKCNKFIPIETVTTEDRMLKIIMDCLCCESHCAYVTDCEVDEEEFAYAYIGFKMPGYEILEKHFDKLFKHND